MNISTDTLKGSQLSQRLRVETSIEHERMHGLMAKANVFANQEQYAQFTLAQYYFQQDIEYLFKFPELADLVPDIEVRGRSQAALLDLQDLGIEPQHEDIATEEVGLLQALGWLYVSEGSTLGAAFLFKEAQKSLGLSAEFGARNLAAYPEGRAKVWKRFVQALDDAQFDQAQQDQVIAGAMSGFARFGKMLEQLNTLK